MEVESFEDEEVAKLLNDWFVSIKVDREERPDVDKVYMTYVQALYGGGGWPLSVFLSPDLRPLMGGTYFPPDDKYGRPGFKTVLRKIKEAWDTKKESLVKSGAFAIEQLSEALAAVATSEKLPDGLPERAVQKCAEQFADSYDSKFGGFGSAPKFPRPVEIQVMLYHKKKLKDNQMQGEATFTISYLTKSCGLSLNDAFSVSKKLCINSCENSDAVLQLLKRYGFTKVQISRLITKWPGVLQSCAEKTLSPKLEFFRSIGVPVAVLPQKLSEYPFLLRRSFTNYFTPWYNYLKSIVQSDKNIVAVFLSSPMAFTHGWPERVPSNILILRERGVPESSIASLMLNKPSMMILKKEKFSAYVDRAVELGFRESKFVFVRALQLFGSMSESTLKHKMDVYRRCGWSESDLTAALLRHPICMKLSQKKIRANMDFLVNELGFNPSDVAQCPTILDYNCDRRMKQRWNVVRMLKARGLMKKSIRITSLFHMSETNFLKRCIANHEEEFPELLDIYRGTMSAPEIGFNENVISK